MFSNWSPNQSQSQFAAFPDNLELNIDNFSKNFFFSLRLFLRCKTLFKSHNR